MVAMTQNMAVNNLKGKLRFGCVFTSNAQLINKVIGQMEMTGFCRDLHSLYDTESFMLVSTQEHRNQLR